MDDAALLAALPGWAFAFALVLSRTGMAVMLLPGLGEAEPPPIVRAGLALAITVLLVPAVAPLVPPPPEIGFGGATMVAAELLVGSLLGWLARLPALALGMAGAVVSYMLGLSSVVQQDAASPRPVRDSAAPRRTSTTRLPAKRRSSSRPSPCRSASWAHC